MLCEYIHLCFWIQIKGINNHVELPTNYLILDMDEHDTDENLFCSSTICTSDICLIMCV